MNNTTKLILLDSLLQETVYLDKGSIEPKDLIKLQFQTDLPIFFYIYWEKIFQATKDNLIWSCP